MREPVELSKAYLLLNHGPVTLVSSAAGGKRNVMAASWAMPLDFAPPKVAVVIDKSAYSRELIEASSEFVLNIPCRAIAGQVLAAGSCCGRSEDKFSQSGLSVEPASIVGAPLVGGCVAWLECKVIPEAHNEQRYDLFLAEVVRPGPIHGSFPAAAGISRTTICAPCTIWRAAVSSRPAMPSR